MKLLAILLDPDKLKVEEIASTIKIITGGKIDFIFVGGSTVEPNQTEICVKEIKKYTNLPIVLFPGDHSQLTNEADAVLFLSLVSGMNSEYLIGQQLKSVDYLKSSHLEIVPTAYLLIDGGTETAVQRVSKTLPIAQTEIQKITNMALASQFMGKDLVYLEAGSGAKIPVKTKIIKSVSNSLKIPIIVGGGIRTQEQLGAAYNNGADLVVIGTAFEENNELLNQLK